MVDRTQPLGHDQREGEGIGGSCTQRNANDAREDEMEDNMQVVGSMLSNLKKNMATDIKARRLRSRTHSSTRSKPRLQGAHGPRLKTCIAARKILIIKMT
jgi:hypothetical protein